MTVTARRDEAVTPTLVLRPVAANAFETTVEQLAAGIRLGVLVEGEPLPPERELAERLGVSRGTVRDAIGALRQAGLVETRRGRGGGTFVAHRAACRVAGVAELPEMTPELIADALDLRRVLEPGAAALAARRVLSAEQRDQLRSALAAVAEADGDDDAHRLADSRFHLTIAMLTGSPSLVEAITKVQADLDAMLRRIPVLRPNIDHSDDQHEQVAAAILAGEDETARHVMDEHVEGTAALLRGLLAMTRPVPLAPPNTDPTERPHQEAP